MNNYISTILTKLVPIKGLLLRYGAILFILIVVGIFAYMTLSIAHYANLEPTSDQVAERQASATSTRLDEESIAKITELQDQNISIESLFDNGRENPFQ